MAEIGMHEAKTTLSKLVERAERGEEIVLTRNGTPVVRLERVARPPSMRDARGAMRGTRFWMAEDFDDLDGLDDEFRDAFGLR